MQRSQGPRDEPSASAENAGRQHVQRSVHAHVSQAKPPAPLPWFFISLPEAILSALLAVCCTGSCGG